jgi:hypothetical protein
VSLNGLLFDIGSTTFVMPFGKHRGEQIAEIPDSYLRWLTSEPGMRQNVKRAAAEELQRRLDLARERAGMVEFVEWCAMTESTPRVVCGVALDAVETALFEYAVAWGELTITPDMPVASPVPEAWRRWCELNALPHAVRQIMITNEGEYYEREL